MALATAILSRSAITLADAQNRRLRLKCDNVSYQWRMLLVKLLH